jgi:hypothetical protein
MVFLFAAAVGALVLRKRFARKPVVGSSGG